MKIQWGKDYKKWMTVEEAEIARLIIKEVSTDFTTDDFREYTGMMANVAAKFCGNYTCDSTNILKMTATISKNAAVDNCTYCENSGHLDIWVDATVYDGYNNFYIIGYYLSDAWKVDAFNEYTEEIINRMYIRHFQETQPYLK